MEPPLDCMSTLLGDWKGPVGVAVILGVAVWAVNKVLWESTRHRSDLYYQHALEQLQGIAGIVGKIAAADRVAAADSKEKILELRKKFYEYYYGPLVLVENKDLEDAMVRMRKSIEKLVAENKGRSPTDKRELYEAALELTATCHDFLQPTLLSQLKLHFWATNKSGKYETVDDL